MDSSIPTPPPSITPLRARPSSDDTRKCKAIATPTRPQHELSRFTMEAFITGLQVMTQYLLCYFMISFQMNFFYWYFLSYALAMASTAMAVMLGCAIEDPKLGQEMLPILFVPQMLLSGLFVASDLIPIWLRWAQYLCSLTYASRIALVAEFDDCGSGGSEAQDNCNNLQNNVGAKSDDVWWYWQSYEDMQLSSLLLMFFDKRNLE
eukprot:scaffold31115_cov58-Attheya_sp.AAC.1